jgi:hypothetical protein
MRAVQPYEYAIALARWLARLQLEFSSAERRPNREVKSRPCARGFYVRGQNGNNFRFITPMRAWLQCNGKGSLWSFIVSLNLHRRHLDASQRAQVADKLTTLKHGQRSDTSKDVSVTQPQAAELLNVSLASVQRARKVRESGDKKLIAAVESGEVTVSAAAQHVAAVTRYHDKAKEARPWKATPLRFSYWIMR